MRLDEPSDKVPSKGKPRCRLDAVPAPAVRRLSLYLRELETFLRQNRQTTSSRELGETLGYTDAQVRKDLAYFGQFGHPGIGYRVEELIARVRAILLGPGQTWKTLVVGAGNLGNALLTYRGFARKGFEMVAVFDSDPAKIGHHIGAARELEILPMDRLAEVVADRRVQIGIITVPAEAAQEVADALVAAGVQGILNFAPTSLSIPENIPLSPVVLGVHLEQLAFRINVEQSAEREQSADGGASDT